MFANEIKIGNKNHFVFFFQNVDLISNESSNDYDDNDEEMNKAKPKRNNHHR